MRAVRFFCLCAVMLVAAASTASADDPEVIRAALFWLGESGDPRAIALFEEILVGRDSDSATQD